MRATVTVAVLTLTVHSGSTPLWYGAFGPAQRKATRRADCAAASEEIGVEPSVEARPGLAPNDPVVPVAQWLRTGTEHQSLALVGHMPFLGRLASLLVAGDEQAQVIGFQMGGLVKLEPKVDRDGFVVAWALPPDLA